MLEQIFEQVEKLYQQGKPEEAIQLAEEKVPMLSPREQVELLLLLIKYRESLGETLKMLEHLKDARKKGEKSKIPSSLEAKLAIYEEKAQGIQAEQQGNLEKALSHYEKGWKLCEREKLFLEGVDFLLRKGETLFQLGKIQQAEQLYQKALELAEREKAQSLQVSALCAQGDLFLQRGNFQKAGELYDRAKSLAEAEKQSLLKVECYLRLARVALYQGQMESAKEWLTKGEDLLKEMSHPSLHLELLSSFGKLYLLQGDYQQAKQYYEKAYHLSEKVKDTGKKVSALGHLGNIAIFQGQVSEGIEHLKKALALARQLGDPQGEMNALGWLGDAYYQKGKNIQALNYYYKALSLAQQIGSLVGEVQNLSRIGDIYFSRYENNTALEKYRESLRLAKKANLKAAVLNNLVSMGEIHFRQGNNGRALQYYEEALTLANDLQSLQGIFNAVQGIGEVCLRQGKFEEALKRFRQALQLSRRLKDPVAEILCLSGIADSYLGLQEEGKAKGYYKEALKLAENIEDEQEVLLQKIKLGELYLRQGKREKARKYLQESYKLARKYDSPEGLLPSLEALAQFDIGEGNYFEAKKKLEEAVHLANRLGDRTAKAKMLALLTWLYLETGQPHRAWNTWEELGKYLEPPKEAEEDKQQRLQSMRKNILALGESLQLSPEDFHRQGWQILEKALFQGTCEEVELVSQILPKISPTRAATLLEKAYRVHQDNSQLLEKLMESIKRLPEEEKFPLLSQLFQQENRESLKLLISRELCPLGHLGAVEYLLSLARTPGPFQMAALQSLGESGQEELKEVLRDLLSSSLSPSAKSAVFMSLMALGDERAEEELYEHISTEDAMAIYITAKALARAGKEEAIQSLESFLNYLLEKESLSEEEQSLIPEVIWERWKYPQRREEFLKKFWKHPELREILLLVGEGKDFLPLEKELEELLQKENPPKLQSLLYVTLAQCGKFSQKELIPQAFFQKASLLERIGPLGAYLILWEQSL